MSSSSRPHFNSRPSWQRTGKFDLLALIFHRLPDRRFRIIGKQRSYRRVMKQPLGKVGYGYGEGKPGKPATTAACLSQLPDAVAIVPASLT
jgi:hypothetical protein